MHISDMKNLQVTKNFNVEKDKMYCPCCKTIEIQSDFLNIVQACRDFMMRPFVVNSFYRCQFYNESLSNSAKKSQHVHGNAIDINTASFSGQERWNLVKFAMNFGLSVGVYSKHIHLDYRKGDLSLWYGSY